LAGRKPVANALAIANALAGRKSIANVLSIANALAGRKSIANVLSIANALAGRKSIANVLSIANALAGRKSIANVLSIANALAGRKSIANVLVHGGSTLTVRIRTSVPLVLLKVKDQATSVARKRPIDAKFVVRYVHVFFLLPRLGTGARRPGSSPVEYDQPATLYHLSTVFR
jgi:hypothetical protein